MGGFGRWFGSCKNEARIGFGCRLGREFGLLLLRFGFGGEPFFLHVLECFDVFGALALKAGFLQVQVAELAGEELHGGEIDEMFAHLFGFVVELAGIAAAALGVDDGFEADDAVEAPGAVVDGLGEAALFRGDGFEFGDGFVEAALVEVGVVGVDQDGGAGEAVFQGVARGAEDALLGARAGRVLSVFAVDGGAAVAGKLGVIGLSSGGRIVIKLVRHAIRGYEAGGDGGWWVELGWRVSGLECAGWGGRIFWGGM